MKNISPIHHNGPGTLAVYLTLPVAEIYLTLPVAEIYASANFQPKLIFKTAREKN